MVDNSNAPLSLPPTVSEEDAEFTIEQWAPLIRLHKHERHLPSKADIFRGSARFRESRSWRDKGWNKREKAWKTGDQHGEDYRDVGWKDIDEQSAAFLQRHDPQAKKAPIARPRDSKNVCGKGSSNGLFLQRRQDLSDDRSGMPAGAAQEITAPVYVDTYYDPVNRMVRVLYWFFYELNHWRFLITHEGDWEHVTMVYREQHFTKQLAPTWVYFAQHDQGEVRQYVTLDKYDTTHRVIYVDRKGHPCHADVDNKRDYIYEWKTWDCLSHKDEPTDVDKEMHFIPRSDWKDYAGAWGEIGETTHTTGPLGPSFKRKDNIRIRKIGLKSYVVMKQK